jgi:hypothetical protein
MLHWCALLTLTSHEGGCMPHANTRTLLNVHPSLGRFSHSHIHIDAHFKPPLPFSHYAAAAAADVSAGTKLTKKWHLSAEWC